MEYKYCKEYDVQVPGYILFPYYGDEKLTNCPVLYLFHGTGGVEEWFESSKGNLICNLTQWLNQNEGIVPMVVVTPQIDVPTSGSKATPFFQFNRKIVEMINYINQKYATYVLSDKKKTAIAGFSMGGAASLYYAHKNNKCFYHVGAFSPSSALYCSWLKEEKLQLQSYADSHNLIGRGGLDCSAILKATKRCVEELKVDNVPIYSDKAVIINNSGHDFNTFNALLERFILLNIFRE